jgi:DNA-binding IclR family transcriptional regulator
VSASRLIRVIQNADQVLAALAGGPKSAAALAGETGIARPTVYRLLGSLESMGFVSPHRGGTFALDMRLIRLAGAAQRAQPEFAAVRPIMEQLQERTGHTIYFAAVRGSRVLCIDWVQGVEISLPALRPGQTLPGNAGATSLAILAHDEQQRAAVLGERRRERLTEHTAVTDAELNAAIELTRERGYSVSDQDVTIGVAAIGAPVFLAGRSADSAIAIAGLRGEIMAEEQHLSRLVQDAAELIRQTAPPS